MKQFSILLLSLLTFFTFSLTSCSCDDCDNAPSYAKCSEHPDKDETTCMAVWESWIYDSETGKCQKMQYSGCEPLGFESQEECEECDCYRLETNSETK